MQRDSYSADHWEYVDFDLEVGEEREPRRYPISVRSPEGEAQGEMRFPFDEWELRDRLRDVEFALLRSGGSRRRIGTPEEQTVQAFGQALFEALLAGDAGTHYRVSWREARRQNKGLRVKLHVRSPELSSLPWEFVYDPKHSYLCLSSRTPLVRYTDVPHPIERLTVTPPLRILGMVASPQGLPQLDVGHEKRLVEEALRGLQAQGPVELNWLEGQTWRDLQRAMRRGPWHVLHFIGHGGFDPETEEGAIALSDEEGRKHLLGATDLALLLDDHYFLRLVFLNSCEGARGSPRDPFSSTAAALVRSGIPAVVAMQYEITDRAAIEFSRSFYDAVADGLPIDTAVAEARTAVKMRSILEWGTPVLYMRSTDGRIFDIPTAAPRAQPTTETQDRRGEDPLRRYREGVESAWVGGELRANEGQRLRDLANNELGLDSGTAADIEREVMGDTIETILERQEEAAREEERNKRLEELYARARELYRNQEWRAVVTVFAQIQAVDSTYPDSEGLLDSARRALATVEKEQDAIHQYREGVELAWADGELENRVVEELEELADRLELRSSDAASIEREVMGDTREALLMRKERAARQRYRETLERAWTDEKLSEGEARELDTLASELGLSADTTADIERQVAGDTVQAILQRQIREDEEHQHHLREMYDRGQRHVSVGEWRQALECLEEVQYLEPGYLETEALLSRARQELAQPPMVEVPDLSGQEVSQASSVLAGKDLQLGPQHEARSDTVPEGRVIEQSPEPGVAVEPGSLVSVTVSSGPSTVEVPDLAGKSHSKVRNILRAAGLEPGMIANAHSDDVREGRVIQQYPEAGNKAEWGASVSITLSSGPQNLQSSAREDTPPVSEGEFSISNPIGSFTQVVWRVVTKPTGFFSAIPRRGSLLAPLIFAIICVEFCIILYGILGILLRLVGIVGATNPSFAFLTGIIWAPILLATGLFIGAGILHLFVMLIVGSRNSGFEATFRVAAYSSVVSLMSWIPYYVRTILILYGIYLIIVGIREVHYTTTGKAVLVILTPVAVILILLVALIILGLTLSV